MIDLSSVVTDPRFAQTFTVKRFSGKWQAGRFVETPTEIQMVGTISIANAKQIQFIPEGDRIGGEIAIHTTQPLYNSRNGTDVSQGGTSDLVIWHNDEYKIYQVNEYSDYGYYFAIGQRKASD
jgi:hypothetical protein